MGRWGLVEVADTELEVVDWGAGEPIVFIQTALTADELLPLAQEAALEDGYRKVVYHRRGYAGSGRVSGPGSIHRDAADCLALLSAIGIETAHIVGVSYSGAVALQMAADAPESVQTLTVIEPPPVQTPSSPRFRALNDQLIRSRQERGADAALDEFMGLTIGPNWQEGAGGQYSLATLAQINSDMITFFDTDLPALLAWEFGRADAGRIACPVLHIGAGDSGPFFAEVRELILDWIPHAQDVVIDGADHWLAVTHTLEVAEALGAFLRKHPV
jgi:3-oxoadipate enol-lactonase